eukprot:GILJ01000650.1.p3 GENE.GILJ01000650.1~~GILJ01000650.1.p3  ORF type:complete len:105 (-),score=7.19 GILJ01000650.1:111-425(-)
MTASSLHAKTTVQVMAYVITSLDLVLAKRTSTGSTAPFPDECHTLDITLSASSIHMTLRVMLLLNFGVPSICMYVCLSVCMYIRMYVSLSYIRLLREVSVEDDV